MGQLDPATYAALKADRPLVVGMVEIDLPTHSLRLLDGAGAMTIDGQPFTGRDATYGVLDTIKGLADVAADQAPSVTIGLLLPTNTALAALLDATLQGSPVTISMGAANMATGQLIGAPYVLLAGEWDVATVKWAEHDRRIEVKITSVAERLFMLEEGRRLSHSFHQTVWPGETGMEFCTDVEQFVDWGQNFNATIINTRTNLPSLGGWTFNRT